MRSKLATSRMELRRARKKGAWSITCTTYVVITRPEASGHVFGVRFLAYQLQGDREASDGPACEVMLKNTTLFEKTRVVLRHWIPPHVRGMKGKELTITRDVLTWRA